MTEEELFNPEPPDFEPLEDPFSKSRPFDNDEPPSCAPAPASMPAPASVPVPVSASPAAPAPSFENQAAALGLNANEQETARRVIKALSVREDDGLVPLVLLQSKTASAFDSVPAAVALATAEATEKAIAAVKACAAAESGAAAQNTASEIKKMIRTSAPSSLYRQWITWAPFGLFVAGLLFGYFWGNAREYQSVWVSSILKTFIVF